MSAFRSRLCSPGGAVRLMPRLGDFAAAGTLPVVATAPMSVAPSAATDFGFGGSCPEKPLEERGTRLAAIARALASSRQCLGRAVNVITGHSLLAPPRQLIGPSPLPTLPSGSSLRSGSPQRSMTPSAYKP
jgi:hypothetical protein